MRRSERLKYLREADVYQQSYLKRKRESYGQTVNEVNPSKPRRKTPDLKSRRKTPKTKSRRKTSKPKSRQTPDNGTFFSLPQNESTLNRSDENIDWTKWIAATDTKNYMMDDGFLDVLSKKSASVIRANPECSKEIGKMISLSANKTGFIPSLMSAGNTFETKVIELLKKEITVKDIGGNLNPRSYQKYQETIQAMNQGVPCIYQGILRNYSNQTYGIPDILIRSDYINQFLDVNALSISEIHIPADNLPVGTKYHYVVVDIKYKSLPLRSDGIHLRNDGNIKAYKSQLWIYNDALGRIQGYCPPYAFILGSKWKYTSMGINFEGKSCFERLARIDYSDLDVEYVAKTERAIQWLNEVKVQEWDLSKYPLPRDELYPNMCNRHDYPYHGIKKSFAEANNDLTLLWNVGPKQRRIANSNGVYDWKDPRCTPANLGVTGKVRSKVLGRILEANHSETRNIFPKYILNNFSDWKNTEERTIEMFVDFETTCSVFSEMDDLPLNTGASLIFLIGVGYIDPQTKEWIFHKFISKELSEKEEARICKEFLSFLKGVQKSFEKQDSLKLWHYSHAEPSFWRRAFENNRYLKNVKGEMEWADLLKVFLKEPIGIKGCLSYNLKTVAKNFYQHGFISTTWDNGSSTASGADVAIEAFRVDLECKKLKADFSKHPIVEDIIKYNEVDCKVLQEILFYLREHHIDPTMIEEIEDDSDDEEYSVMTYKRTNKPLKKRKIVLETEDSDLVLYE